MVTGAKQAQDAGVALEEIESVSTSLAALIRNISEAAKQQANSATEVSKTMSVIKQITDQTVQNTKGTSKSIGELTTMASEMHKSVEGFRLPQDHAA